MEQELDLLDGIVFIRRKRLPIFIMTILIILAVGIKDLFKPFVYETYGMLTIGKTSDGRGGSSLIELPEATINEVLSENTLMEISKTISNGSKKIRKRIRIEGNNNLLKVITTGSTAENAVELNRKITDHIIARHREIYDARRVPIDKFIDEKKKLISDAGEKIGGVKNLKNDAEAIKYLFNINQNTKIKLSLQADIRDISYSFESTRELIAAYPPEYPLSRKRKKSLILAAIFGFIGSTLVVAISEYLKRNKSRMDQI